MNRTKIEWCDYTWNPVKGLCPVGCWYCYARKMYKRFGWDETIRLDEKELSAPLNLRKPSRIFVGSTIDLFHPQIYKVGIRHILRICKLASRHTFIFLTKFPDQYAVREFPPNCWLGMTITGDSDEEFIKVLTFVDISLDASNVTFISYEPMLGFQQPAVNLLFDWMIVGALTGHGKSPHKKEWIEEIVSTFREEKRPLFLKNNLNWPEKIQEYPK